MNTLENLTGLNEPEHLSNSHALKGNGYTGLSLRKRFSIVQRILVTCASVSVSICIPEFSIAMAFLGSFLAFTLSIVGPIVAKMKIEGKCHLFDVVVMFMGAVMAIWGTIATFTT
jgi:vesicular inhibitory amino acid transporter